MDDDLIKFNLNSLYVEITNAEWLGVWRERFDPAIHTSDLFLT